MTVRLKARFTFFLLAFGLNASIFGNEPITPVSVVAVQSGQVNEEVPLTGSVTSIRTSSISPKESGYVETISVDEGDMVNRGDRILQLDKQLAEIEITRVRAQLDEAIASVKEFERQRDEAAELVEKKHIASTAFKAAAAQVEINKAVVQRLRAELRHQQVIAERHQVVAPFSGVISEKLVEVGQWVDSNTALFRLTELDPLRIEVPVPQFYFNRIQTGTPVTIRFDAIPSQLLQAIVSKRVPVSNQTARTFPVFIRFSNAELIVTPGMSVRVIFQLKDKNSGDTLFIPRDAIVQSPNGDKTVWVVASNDGKDTVKPIAVQTGNSIRQHIEIDAADLAVGDRVVIKGNGLLRPGQNVNIIEQVDYRL